MSRHSRGVTRNKLYLENVLDDGFWDDYEVETEYFEEDVAPLGSSPDDAGRVKGEFDVAAVNYSEKVFLYVEVKSNPRDLSCAQEQLERAERHFEGFGWDMVGQVWLEER